MPSETYSSSPSRAGSTLHGEHLGKISCQGRLWSALFDQRWKNENKANLRYLKVHLDENDSDDKNDNGWNQNSSQSLKKGSQRTSLRFVSILFQNEIYIITFGGQIH